MKLVAVLLVVALVAIDGLTALDLYHPGSTPSKSAEKKGLGDGVSKKDGLTLTKKTSHEEHSRVSHQEDSKRRTTNQNGGNTHHVGSVDERSKKHQTNSAYDEKSSTEFGLGNGGLVSSQSGSKYATNSENNNDFRRHQQIKDDHPNSGNQDGSSRTPHNPSHAIHETFVHNQNRNLGSQTGHHSRFQHIHNNGHSNHGHNRDNINEDLSRVLNRAIYSDQSISGIENQRSNSDQYANIVQRGTANQYEDVNSKYISDILIQAQNLLKHEGELNGYGITPAHYHSIPRNRRPVYGYPNSGIGFNDYDGATGFYIANPSASATDDDSNYDEVVPRYVVPVKIAPGLNSYPNGHSNRHSYYKNGGFDTRISYIPSTDGTGPTTIFGKNPGFNGVAPVLPTNTIIPVSTFDNDNDDEAEVLIDSTLTSAPLTPLTLWTPSDNDYEGTSRYSSDIIIDKGLLLKHGPKIHGRDSTIKKVGATSTNKADIDQTTDTNKTGNNDGSDVTVNDASDNISKGNDKITKPVEAIVIEKRTVTNNQIGQDSNNDKTDESNKGDDSSNESRDDDDAANGKSGKGGKSQGSENGNKKESDDNSSANVGKGGKSRSNDDKTDKKIGTTTEINKDFTDKITPATHSDSDNGETSTNKADVDQTTDTKKTGNNDGSDVTVNDASDNNGKGNDKITKPVEYIVTEKRTVTYNQIRQDSNNDKTDESNKGDDSSNEGRDDDDAANGKSGKGGKSQGSENGDKKESDDNSFANVVEGGKSRSNDDKTDKKIGTITEINNDFTDKITPATHSDSDNGETSTNKADVDQTTDTKKTGNNDGSDVTVNNASDNISKGNDKMTKPVESVVIEKRTVTYNQIGQDSNNDKTDESNKGDDSSNEGRDDDDAANGKSGKGGKSQGSKNGDKKESDDNSSANVGEGGKSRSNDDKTDKKIGTTTEINKDFTDKITPATHSDSDNGETSTNKADVDQTTDTKKTGNNDGSDVTVNNASDNISKGNDKMTKPVESVVIEKRTVTYNQIGQDSNNDKTDESNKGDDSSNEGRDDDDAANGKSGKGGKSQGSENGDKKESDDNSSANVGEGGKSRSNDDKTDKKIGTTTEINKDFTDKITPATHSDSDNGETSTNKADVDQTTDTKKTGNNDGSDVTVNNASDNISKGNDKMTKPVESVVIEKRTVTYNQIGQDSNNDKTDESNKGDDSSNEGRDDDDAANGKSGKGGKSQGSENGDKKESDDNSSANVGEGGKSRSNDDKTDKKIGTTTEINKDFTDKITPATHSDSDNGETSTNKADVDQTTDTKKTGNNDGSDVTVNNASDNISKGNDKMTKPVESVVIEKRTVTYNQIGQDSNNDKTDESNKGDDSSNEGRDDDDAANGKSGKGGKSQGSENGDKKESDDNSSANVGEGGKSRSNDDKTNKKIGTTTEINKDFTDKITPATHSDSDNGETSTNKADVDQTTDTKKTGNNDGSDVTVNDASDNISKGNDKITKPVESVVIEKRTVTYNQIGQDSNNDKTDESNKGDDSSNEGRDDDDAANGKSGKGGKSQGSENGDKKESDDNSSANVGEGGKSRSNDDKTDKKIGTTTEINKDFTDKITPATHSDSDNGETSTNKADVDQTTDTKKTGNNDGSDVTVNDASDNISKGNDKITKPIESVVIEKRTVTYNQIGQDSNNDKTDESNKGDDSSNEGRDDDDAANGKSGKGGKSQGSENGDKKESDDNSSANVGEGGKSRSNDDKTDKKIGTTTEINKDFTDKITPATHSDSDNGETSTNKADVDQTTDTKKTGNNDGSDVTVNDASDNISKGNDKITKPVEYIVTEKRTVTYNQIGQDSNNDKTDESNKGDDSSNEGRDDDDAANGKSGKGGKSQGSENGDKKESDDNSSANVGEGGKSRSNDDKTDKKIGTTTEINKDFTDKITPATHSDSDNGETSTNKADVDQTTDTKKTGNNDGSDVTVNDASDNISKGNDKITKPVEYIVTEKRTVTYNQIGQDSNNDKTDESNKGDDSSNEGRDDDDAANGKSGKGGKSQGSENGDKKESDDNSSANVGEGGKSRSNDDKTDKKIGTTTEINKDFTDKITPATHSDSDNGETSTNKADVDQTTDTKKTGNNDGSDVTVNDASDNISKGNDKITKPVESVVIEKRTVTYNQIGQDSNNDKTDESNKGDDSSNEGRDDDDAANGKSGKGGKSQGSENGDKKESDDNSSANVGEGGKSRSNDDKTDKKIGTTTEINKDFTDKITPATHSDSDNGETSTNKADVDQTTDTKKTGNNDGSDVTVNDASDNISKGNDKITKPVESVVIEKRTVTYNQIGQDSNNDKTDESNKGDDSSNEGRDDDDAANGKSGKGGKSQGSENGDKKESDDNSSANVGEGGKSRSNDDKTDKKIGTTTEINKDFTDKITPATHSDSDNGETSTNKADVDQTTDTKKTGNNDGSDVTVNDASDNISKGNDKMTKPVESVVIEKRTVTYNQIGQDSNNDKTDESNKGDDSSNEGRDDDDAANGKSGKGGKSQGSENGDKKESDDNSSANVGEGGKSRSNDDKTDKKIGTTTEINKDFTDKITPATHSDSDNGETSTNKADVDQTTDTKKTGNNDGSDVTVNDASDNISKGNDKMTKPVESIVIEKRTVTYNQIGQDSNNDKTDESNKGDDSINEGRDDDDAANGKSGKGGKSQGSENGDKKESDDNSSANVGEGGKSRSNDDKTDKKIGTTTEINKDFTDRITPATHSDSDNGETSTNKADVDQTTDTKKTGNNDGSDGTVNDASDNNGKGNDKITKPVEYIVTEKRTVTYNQIGQDSNNDKTNESNKVDDSSNEGRDDDDAANGKSGKGGKSQGAKNGDQKESDDNSSANVGEGGKSRSNDDKTDKKIGTTTEINKDFTDKITPATHSDSDNGETSTNKADIDQTTDTKKTGNNDGSDVTVNDASDSNGKGNDKITKPVEYIVTEERTVTYNQIGQDSNNDKTDESNKGDDSSNEGRDDDDVANGKSGKGGKSQGSENGDKKESDDNSSANVGEGGKSGSNDDKTDKKIGTTTEINKDFTDKITLATHSDSDNGETSTNKADVDQTTDTKKTGNNDGSDVTVNDASDNISKGNDKMTKPVESIVIEKRTVTYNQIGQDSNNDKTDESNKGDDSSNEGRDDDDAANGKSGKGGKSQGSENGDKKESDDNSSANVGEGGKSRSNDDKTDKKIGTTTEINKDFTDKITPATHSDSDNGETSTNKADVDQTTYTKKTGNNDGSDVTVNDASDNSGKGNDKITKPVEYIVTEKRTVTYNQIGQDSNNDKKDESNKGDDSSNEGRDDDDVANGKSGKGGKSQGSENGDKKESDDNSSANVGDGGKSGSNDDKTDKKIGTTTEINNDFTDKITPATHSDSDNGETSTNKADVDQTTDTKKTGNNDGSDVTVNDASDNISKGNDKITKPVESVVIEKRTVTYNQIGQDSNNDKTDESNKGDDSSNEGRDDDDAANGKSGKGGKSQGSENGDKKESDDNSSANVGEGGKSRSNDDKTDKKIGRSQNSDSSSNEDSDDTTTGKYGKDNKSGRNGAHEYKYWTKIGKVLGQKNNRNRNNKTLTKIGARSGQDNKPTEDGNSAVNDKIYKTNKHNDKQVSNNGNDSTSTEVTREHTDKESTNANDSQENTAIGKHTTSGSKNNSAGDYDDHNGSEKRSKYDSTQKTATDKTNDDFEQKNTSSVTENDDSDCKKSAKTHISNANTKITSRLIDNAFRKSLSKQSKQVAKIIIQILQQKSKNNNNNAGSKTTIDSSKSTSTDDGETQYNNNGGTANNNGSENSEDGKSIDYLTNTKDIDTAGSQSNDNPKPIGSKNRTAQSSQTTTDSRKPTSTDNGETQDNNNGGTANNNGNKYTYSQSSGNNEHSKQQKDSKFTDKTQDSKATTVQSEQRSATEENKNSASDNYAEVIDGNVKTFQKESFTSADNKKQEAYNSESKIVDSYGNTEQRNYSSSERKFVESSQSSFTESSRRS